MSFFQNKKAPFFAFAATLLVYFFLGYFVPRENFSMLIVCYTVSFSAFILLVQNSHLSERQLFGAGLLFRAIFLFCIPFWSQDFYRFIWDGRLIVLGENPFIFLPKDIIETTAISQATELFNGMGSLSAQHYSNYPPFNQFLFALAVLLSKNSIFLSAFLFKLFIILGDIGVYFYGKKLLLLIGQNPKKIVFYFLNPLVIIELTGNLHFEGIMLCFFVIGLFYFFENQWKISAVCIGLSIATKLLPLLLLPFFYQKLGFKKSVVFYTLVISLNLLLFLPFLSTTLVSNYTETIGLWFTNFEFNASIYYLVREVGFWVKGYNIIGIVGQITPIVTVLMIASFALLRNNKKADLLFTNMLLALAIYFFLATTVHPWYIINLIFLSVFAKYKFPIYWSFVVVLSYFAYRNPEFKENFYVLFVEYLVVFGVFFYELFTYKKKIPHG